MEFAPCIRRKPRFGLSHTKVGEVIIKLVEYLVRNWPKFQEDTASKIEGLYFSCFLALAAVCN